MTMEAYARSGGKVLGVEDFDTVDPNAVDADFALDIVSGKLDDRSRPFKILRTKFRKRTEQHHARLVGITSATPGAGKSFIAMNLAASLSLVSEIPVYAVDLDLRRQSLTTRLGMTGLPGISDVLQEKAPDLMSVGKRFADTNLVILPAGSDPRGAADMVASSAFTTLIGQMRAISGNSIVLVDLPPAFASDDAMLIMKHLDAYILIVEAGITSKRQVREVLSMMAPSPFMGSVMNRFNGGFADSYGYGYGYGSGAYGQYYD